MRAVRQPARRNCDLMCMTLLIRLTMTKTLIPKKQLNSRTLEAIRLREAVTPYARLFTSCNRKLTSVFAIIKSYRELVSVAAFINYFRSFIQEVGCVLYILLFLVFCSNIRNIILCSGYTSGVFEVFPIQYLGCSCCF